MFIPVIVAMKMKNEGLNFPLPLRLLLRRLCLCVGHTVLESGEHVIMHQCAYVREGVVEYMHNLLDSFKQLIIREAGEVGKFWNSHLLVAVRATR